MSKDRISILVFTHSSHLAGAERSLIDLIRELILKYHISCTVILPSEGPSVKTFQDLGAETIIASYHWWCIDANSPLTEKIHDRNSDSFSWIIEKLPDFQRINPDIVLTNTIVIPWGAIAAALLERPHIWLINEYGVADHGLKFFFPFDDVLGFIERSSNAIITRSKAIQSELFPNVAKEKIQTIYRYIHIPEQQHRDLNLQQNYFTNSRAFHVIIPGTIMKSKGQEDAVRSVIELIKNRNRHVELILLGLAEENYLRSLQETISNEEMEEHIHILPFEEDAIPIINCADTVLVCSRNEAFGRVVMEGLLLKKPVIATNSGGTPEMIIDGKTGLLYTPGDWSQLADQIERLIDNPHFKNRLAKQGYQYATENFTRENFSNSYYQLITKLLVEKTHNKGAIESFLSDQFHKTIIYLKDKVQSQVAIIADLQAQVNEREQSIQQLNHSLAEREQSIQQLNHSLAEREQSIQQLNHTLAEREQSIQQLNHALAEREEEVLFYAASKSWKITRPLRKVVKWFKRIL